MGDWKGDGEGGKESCGGGMREERNGDKEEVERDCKSEKTEE